MWWFADCRFFVDEDEEVVSAYGARSGEVKEAQLQPDARGGKNTDRYEGEPAEMRDDLASSRGLERSTLAAASGPLEQNCWYGPCAPFPEFGVWRRDLDLWVGDLRMKEE